MAVQGPWTTFDLANEKILDGIIKLNSDAFQIVLCTSSQALGVTFAGTSGNAQYSDLTGELTTANGYTNGGLALSSVTLTESAGVVTFDSANPAWTLTGGGITFKYAVIFDNTGANKDLLCFCNMDTGGGSVSSIAGAMSITNPGAIFTVQRA